MKFYVIDITGFESAENLENSRKSTDFMGQVLKMGQQVVAEAPLGGVRKAMGKGVRLARGAMAEDLVAKDIADVYSRRVDWVSVAWTLHEQGYHGVPPKSLFAFDGSRIGSARLFNLRVVV